MASQTGSIDLTSSNSVKLAAEAGWQSDLNRYYTKSEIDVTVGGINSTVSTKVGEDEVISSINQSSESVSINASKINLTGAVTISDLAADANNALTDAAKTATNYIRADSTGVRIANANPSTATTYQHLTATNTEFVAGGETVASFGSTVTLASDDGNHLVLDGDEFAFLDQDDNRLFYIDPYDGDGIPEDSSVALSTDSGWFVVDAGGLAYLRVGSDDIEMHVKEGNASASALYASGSEVRVYQPLYADEGVDSSGRIVAQQRIESRNSLGNVALEAANSGNKGVFDTTDGVWIICRNSDDNIVINGDNFSVDASGLVNAGRKVVAAGNKMVALAATVASGSTNRGLWDETGGAWIIYRSTDGSIVLGSSAADTLYHRTSTCTINSTNATLYNNLNNCWNNGACCTITLAVKLKAALASGSTVDIATAPENFRPPNTVSGSVYVTGQSVDLQAQVYASGLIRLNNRSGSSASTSAQIYVTFTFAL